MQQLDEALKPHLERQNYRKSLLLNEYSLNLTVTFTAKLLPNFALADDIKQLHSSQLRLSKVVDTATRRRTIEIVHSNEQAIEELNRELCIFEAANVDMKTKLSGQLAVLGAYINKVLFNRVEGRRVGKSTAKMDVFTRLYQQAPARYKVKNREAKVTGNVSRLKMLFSRKGAQQQSSTPLAATPRKQVAVSSKIKSICKQFSEQQLCNMVVPQSERMAKWRA